MKNLLVDLAGYNQWANERISAALQKLTPSQLNLEQKSSFNSIRKTTGHIADCEFNWLKRINGDSTWEPNAKDFSATDKLTGFWLQQSNRFVKLVEQSSDKELAEVIAYKNMKGEAYSNELYKIITHVMNHSNYHRGQLITLMRGAGETQIPATDLIVYYRLAVTV